MTDERVPVRGRSSADRWPLSSFHLVGLAAGGVIGSGWLFTAPEVYQRAGSKAWMVWLVGGLLMLLIAWVMVELARYAPKTGGLIFLPLQSSGPLVATAVASGLWIFYVINLVTESMAMANGLSGRSPSVRPAGALDWFAVIGCMAVISALNLLLPRIFFRISSWITVLKVGIIVATVIVLLGYFSGSPHPPAVATKDVGWVPALTSVVGSGVIYAFVGFQGPLDFAGNIQQSTTRRRRSSGGTPEPVRPEHGEAARLRWAVLGTLVGSALLYMALQFVYMRYGGSTAADVHGCPRSVDSPFVSIACQGRIHALVWALRIGGVVAPMGAGLVFAHALTREVAALGRAHLTHRGLQTASRTKLLGHRGIYWLVLVVDLFIAVAILGLVRGSRSTLVEVTGVLALVVYAMPGVVLVARGEPTTGRKRRTVQHVLARASFGLIGLVLYMTGWPELWRGLVALAAGCAVLLGLPLISLARPGFGRFYDAKAHARLFRHWRDSAAAQAVLVLFGYLALLALLTLWGNPSPPNSGSTGHHHVGVVQGVVALLAALGAFEGLIRTSRRYAAEGNAGTAGRTDTP